MASSRYEDEVFRLLYKNIGYNGNFGTSKGGCGIITSLFYLLIGLLVAGLIGLWKVCSFTLPIIKRKLKEAKENAKANAETKKEQEETKREEKISDELLKKATLTLYDLISNNCNYVQYSIIQTKRGTDNNMYYYINFTVNDYKTGQVLWVNDLINTVCNFDLKISTRDGAYLKGAIILGVDKLDELEGRLRQALQIPLSFILA